MTMGSNLCSHEIYVVSIVSLIMMTFTHPIPFFHFSFFHLLSSIASPKTGCRFERSNSFWRPRGLHDMSTFMTDWLPYTLLGYFVARSRVTPLTHPPHFLDDGVFMGLRKVGTQLLNIEWLPVGCTLFAICTYIHTYFIHDYWSSLPSLQLYYYILFISVYSPQR